MYDRIFLVVHRIRWWLMVLIFYWWVFVWLWSPILDLQDRLQWEHWKNALFWAIFFRLSRWMFCFSPKASSWFSSAAFLRLTLQCETRALLEALLQRVMKFSPNPFISSLAFNCSGFQWQAHHTVLRRLSIRESSMLTTCPTYRSLVFISRVSMLKHFKICYSI